jgi:MoaA/NifB/PqqE/SkfB family radical SAM enzyme
MVTRPRVLPRLWIYTNFDCNLQCTYCVARSSPRAERRAFGLPQFRRLVDEAGDLGVEELFLTGGEPFILPDINERLIYAADRIPTVVLTNAMLFTGRRRERLPELRGHRLTFQVSLDGPDAATHDAYRGAGSFEKAVAGIRTLMDLDFQVVLSTTETPANADKVAATRAFVRALGLPEDRHFLRPLARRGFSSQGIEVGWSELEPEMTVSVDGAFWHPLGTDDDLLLTRRVFPLADAFARLESAYAGLLEKGGAPRPFR